MAKRDQHERKIQLLQGPAPTSSLHCGQIKNISQAFQLMFAWPQKPIHVYIWE